MKKNPVSFQCPSDRSAVSLLATNKVRDGDRFDSNGYVYHKDGTFSVWVDRINGVSIKAPLAKDLLALEARIFALRERLRERAKEIWAKLEAHAQHKRIRGTHKGSYVEYIPGKGITFSFGADLSEYPRPLRQKLLPELLRLNRWEDRYWGWRGTFLGVLYAQILRAVSAQIPRSDAGPYFPYCMLPLNGRTYLLVPAGAKVGGWAVAGVVEDMQVLKVPEKGTL